MDKKAIYSGSPFEKQAGYARAIKKGDMVFVSGTVGYDFGTAPSRRGLRTKPARRLRPSRRP